MNFVTHGEKVSQASGYATRVSGVKFGVKGSIQHHVTGCEDLPIETSILIEYHFEQHLE